MSRRLFLSSLALLLVSSLAGLCAMAEELSSRELKKIAKQGERAFKSGQDKQAAELYQRILDATAPGDDRRSRGLLAVAWIRLASGTAAGEATARRHLDELAESFPRHARRREILAVRSLLTNLRVTRTALETTQAELAEREAAFEAERRESEEKQAQVAGESEEAVDRVRSLESQLRRARAELAETRGELAKKEEALERLLKLRAGRSSD